MYAQHNNRSNTKYTDYARNFYEERNFNVASRNDTSPSPSRMDYLGKKSLVHRGRRKLRPTIPICPGILLRQNMDQWQAKKIWFFKNGDEHYHRYEYIFRPGRDIRDMEGLCDVLSKRLPLARGVRYIFALDGFPIFSVGELENGQSYVASSTKAFKALNYSSNIESVPATVDDLVCRPPRPPSAGEFRAPPDSGRMGRERSFNTLQPRRSPHTWVGGNQTHNMPKTFTPHLNDSQPKEGVYWTPNENSTSHCWGNPTQVSHDITHQQKVVQQQRYSPVSYPPKTYQPSKSKLYAPQIQQTQLQHEYPILQESHTRHYGLHPQSDQKKKEKSGKYVENEEISLDPPFQTQILTHTIDKDYSDTTISSSTIKNSNKNHNGEFSNLPDNLPTAIPLEDNPRYTKSHDIAKERPHSVCRPLPRQVIRIINGNNTTIQCQVLLNTKTAQEWEDLIKDLAMAVKIPRGIASWMETLQGRPVAGYSGLGKELEAGNQGFYLYGDKHDMDKLMATQDGQPTGPIGPVPAIKIIAHGRRGSIAAMGTDQLNKNRVISPELSGRIEFQHSNENDMSNNQISPVTDGRKSSFSPDDTIFRKNTQFPVSDFQNQTDNLCQHNNFSMEYVQKYENHDYESRHSSSHLPSPLKSALKTSSSYNVEFNPDLDDIDGKKKEKKRRKKKKSVVERSRVSVDNPKAISFVSLSPSTINEPNQRQVV